MITKALAAIILAAVSAGAVHAQRSADFVAKESIGGLRIGSSESEVKKGAQCPLKIGEITRSATLKPAGERGLFGPSMYHEEWDNVPCGIKVGMAGRAGREFAVESIAVFAPSTMATARGIRIGSTEEEVEKVYAADWNRQVDERGTAFVAGSVERGLIFYFQNGRVIRMFLKAPAN